VIPGNLAADHVTVARFICRDQLALSELFTDGDFPRFGGHLI